MKEKDTSSKKVLLVCQDSGTREELFRLLSRNLTDCVVVIDADYVDPLKPPTYSNGMVAHDYIIERPTAVEPFTPRRRRGKRKLWNS